MNDSYTFPKKTCSITKKDIPNASPQVQKKMKEISEYIVLILVNPVHTKTLNTSKTSAYPFLVSCLKQLETKNDTHWSYDHVFYPHTITYLYHFKS